MQGHKKTKLNEDAVSVPKEVNIRFTDSKQQSLGVFNFSVEATPKEFQEVLNKLASKEDQEQYTFFYQTKEIKTKLQLFFKQISYTAFEDDMEVSCHPNAHFMVKPITRSASSMYGHTEAVLSISFSPDGNHLASGSGDGTLRFWDVHTQTPMKTIKAQNWVMLVQWSPDSQKLAYSDKNGLITIYDPAKETEVILSGHSKWVTALAWRPLHLCKEHCNELVSSSKDLSLRLWNTDSGLCLRSFGHHTKSITKVIWSGRGEIYSCSEDQRINCFDNDGNYLKDLKQHSHWVNSMSLSTEHVLRRGCYEPGKLYKGEKKNEKALQLYKKATQTHGERLVTGSDDFTLQLFVLPDKKPIKQMVGHGKPINHVQFSPDGRYIVSGSFDKKIKLWDGYTGEFMYTFTGHVGPVYLIVWSVDSRFLVSGSQDSTLKLWDIKTRKLMMDLPGHADQVYALDWDINGRLVASGGKDRQLKLWTN